MILKFGARCRSHAELLGTLHAVGIESHERIVLSLVVEQPQATPLVRVRVPFNRIEAADPDQVALTMTPADFRALPQHGTEASRTPRRPQRGTRSSGPDERALTARTKIECRDGEVGVLTHVVVDPRSGDILGFAFPFGLHVMRNIQVGVDQVAEMAADRVTFRFDMNELEHFPTLHA